LLCTAPFFGVFAAAGCKDKDEPNCANPTAPACVVAAPLDGASPNSEIPTTECIAASLRAIITIESQAAALGVSMATDQNVKAVATQMASDFAADKTNLDAVEARNSFLETPCSVTDTVSGRLTASLQQLMGASGAGFDQAFVSTQVDALTEAKRSINEDLIGWVNSGDLKTSLRFDRQRALDGAPAVTATDFLSDAAALGIVPDLKQLQELLGMGQMPPAPDGGSDAPSSGTGDAGAGG
jgi:predicted outer membrane protein